MSERRGYVQTYIYIYFQNGGGKERYTNFGQKGVNYEKYCIHVNMYLDIFLIRKKKTKLFSQCPSVRLSAKLLHT